MWTEHKLPTFLYDNNDKNDAYDNYDNYDRIALLKSNLLKATWKITI
jgi:hypothetical protein